eukprot:c12932_g1_i1.p1 GENE.c12932_g1_i1~~c12932_g1_i1.p1  ORF type:complete len:337 (+),score=61.90 c12932_g1_i1:57-1013(+)
MTFPVASFQMFLDKDPKTIELVRTSLTNLSFIVFQIDNPSWTPTISSCLASCASLTNAVREQHTSHKRRFCSHHCNNNNAFDSLDFPERVQLKLRNVDSTPCPECQGNFIDAEIINTDTVEHTSVFAGMLAAREAMAEVARASFSVLEDSLGFRFDQVADPSGYVVDSFYYPPSDPSTFSNQQPPPPPPSGESEDAYPAPTSSSPCPAHVDAGLITMVVDTAPGLEVQTVFADGTKDWVGLRLGTNRVCVVLGRSLETLSRNTLNACRHRVAATVHPRVSLVFETNMNSHGVHLSQRRIKEKLEALNPPPPEKRCVVM